MRRLIIEGQPHSKIRPRIKRFGRHISMYDPKEDEKNIVKMLMKAYCLQNNLQPLTGPISFTSIHYFKPTQQSRDQLNSKLWNESLTVGKPDIDNVLKFYLDCANTVLFCDDAQVVHCEAVKRYSIRPRTEIIIKETTMQEIDTKDKNIIYMFSPKELQEFSDDCKCVGGFFDESVEMGEKGIEPVWASTAASLLKSFSERWSPKLTKIGKK